MTPPVPGRARDVPWRAMLGAAALDELRDRPFGVYVHVPWCASRCGYCDFNTYVPGRLRGAAPDGYAATAEAEARLMGAALDGAAPPASTVFFGGGTPTLLPAAALARVLRAIADAVGLAPGAEITTEANPETVDPVKLAELRAAGFTRISLGMQSAAPHVLRTLERAHTPGRAAAAAREARAAGFEHVSLDLIYGAPGERDDDWRASLEAALAAEPDHLSAYALTLEPGTRMTAAVRAGRLPQPDEDALARRYELADARLSQAGLHWYEVSNWAVSDGARCRHNLGYWRGGHWWALGPGAHGHAGGVRFWTLRHPAAHAAAVAEGRLPVDGHEGLDAEARRLERIMLELRLADGLDLDVLDDAGRGRAATLAADGLLELRDGRAILTLGGRRLADTVVRALA
jgi:oxygen-independent coproporphyrinogen-3 oxidase